MHTLCLEELEAAAADVDELLAGHDDLDRFCSSTYWTVPAHLAFAPRRTPWLRRSDAGYCLLAHTVYQGRAFLEPLEVNWGFASPFVYSDAAALARDFARKVYEPGESRPALLLSGLRPGGRMFKALVETLSLSSRLLRGASIRRYRASLEGGIDGFMSRRSRKFRANLRRCRRLVMDAGFHVERIARIRSESEAAALHARMLAVEARSWKGEQETGLCEATMSEFYRLMLLRLWPHDLARITFARLDDGDAGYVFGAVHLGVYRGLQMSFDQRFSKLSLGSVLQVEMLRMLCEEKVAVYDLGMEVPYKEKWADETFETVQLIAL